MGAKQRSWCTDLGSNQLRNARYEWEHRLFDRNSALRIIWVSRFLLGFTALLVFGVSEQNEWNHNKRKRRHVF